MADDDELAAFHAELAAVEATTTNEADVADGNASPEEKRFEDDDGTWYRWDPTTRKFVPEGEDVPAPPAAPAAPAPPPVTWSEADMVFDAGDEPAMPSLRDAKRTVADAKGPDPATQPSSAKPGDGDAPIPGDAPRDASVPGPGDASAPGPIPIPGPDGDEGSKMRAVAAKAIAREKDRRAKRAAASGASGDGWNQPKTNTSVYVNGLPLDVTEEEIREVFSKCGVIRLDPETDAPKIKLYRDKDTGAPKGDGLVTYLKAPSVALACTILDGAPFRSGDGGGTPISVTEAKFEMKGDAYVQRGNKGSKKRKAAAYAKQEKALDWGGFDDARDRKRTTVILKRMFTLEEMFSDPNFRVELEEDVEGEARKFGQVDAVKVFTTNPEGAVSVRFKEETAAAACVAAMRGRWFGGVQLEALMWDGVTNYAKAGAAEESAAEEAARLEAFGEALEADDDAPRERESEPNHAA